MKAAMDFMPKDATVSVSGITVADYLRCSQKLTS